VHLMGMEAAHEILADPSPASLTDEEIVARVCAGERHLFEHLMRRHNQQVYRAARAVLRDDGETEDVMQDAYVRAYEHLCEFEGRSRFSTWLTRIALHEAFARARRRKRFDSLESRAEDQPMPAAAIRNPEQLAGDVEMHDLIEKAVGSLPEEFRSVFVLRAVQGMKGTEVAACLGIRETTVKTRLFRARARLQELLVASAGTAVREVYEFHLSRCDRVVSAVLERLRDLRSLTPALQLRH
jgi:RNA polymerase sigma-70 factor, ECF subfamily